MRLTHLLNKKIVIARLVTDSGDKQIFSTVTVEMGHIQPADSKNSEITEGVFGKSFRVYMDGYVDVQEGDKLRDTGNDETYKVSSDGVSRRTFGSFDYLICALEKTR